MIAEEIKRDVEDWAAAVLRENRLLGRARQGQLPPRSAATYLESVRYLTSRTVPNLATAAEVAAARGRPALAAYFREKVDEEIGHDRWAEADLAHFDDAMVEALWVPDGMRSLVDYQRSLAQRDPTAMLVHCFWAEYHVVLLAEEWLSALEVSGFPRAGFTFVTKHAEADAGHASEGLRELQQLILPSDDHAALRCVVAESSAHFDRFCEEVCDAGEVAA